MTMLEEFHDYSDYMERAMLLRTAPIGVKMLRDETEIPPGAVRPFKDKGCHLAQCQAFSLSRRKGATVAMMKEDNWCWGPLLAYGLIDPAVAAGYRELQKDINHVPALEHGRYAGIVSGPLKQAGFVPDAVLIYSNTAQLRALLYALSFMGEPPVSSTLYPIASCALSVVPALSGRYGVTLPDPGEFGRALAGEDEIIFSLPAEKLEALVAQLKKLDEMKMGYRDGAFREMRPDFPRPDFYKRLYRECGLYADDEAVWPEAW
jgi:uncharacterized protein (DUF169 family)